MKKFIVISLTLLTLSAPAWCCGGEWNLHNNYLFSVFPRELMNTNLFTDRIDAFWESYTNGKVDNYRWNAEIIMETAQKKGDQEMVDYLKMLNKYMEISDQLAETWDYPTKEQLQKRKIDLNTMVSRANNYKGQKLKAQWQLLLMRANLLLGKNADNITFWEQKGSKLPASVYRDMMYNIYAGSLLRVDRRREACDIYAEQGDMVSIKWAMRKMRNLGGIKTIYDEAPNSATINFLIQDFVNNVQETIDSDGYKEWVEEQLDRRIIQRNEAYRFIDYANNVVKGGKTKSPALWMAAVGELQYLFGEHQKAMNSLNQAVKMEGTQRMKDNARAIRIIASIPASKMDNSYKEWLTGELNWLIEKVKEENKNNPENIYDNHYFDVFDRLIYRELMPKYESMGRNDMSAALSKMLECSEMSVYGKSSSPCYDSYSSQYFSIVDLMTPEQTIKHFDLLSSGGKDALERFVISHTNSDKNFFNDLIGTKYLANGQFEQAIPYLQKVSLKFMEGQNISYYLANRDYTTARWMGKQETGDAECDGPNQGKLTSNPKVNFCRDMLKLLNQYGQQTGEARKKTAYDLATRYFQASHLGDCWYLTRYGQSVNDTARTDRPDFVRNAMGLLEESAQSSETMLRANSLFGLAYIPYGPWCETDYDWEKNKYIYTPIPTNRQYIALRNLSSFVKQKGINQMPVYIQKCDVLKQFRQMN